MQGEVAAQSAHAGRAEAERDALRAAVREWVDADEAVLSAARDATTTKRPAAHDAWGRARATPRPSPPSAPSPGRVDDERIQRR